MLKVVVDANIWISALLNSKNALAVVSLLELQEFQLICAEPLLDELAEVIERPKFREKIRDDRKAELLELVRETAHFIELPALVDRVCRDPKDDVYLLCAVAAQADLLLSGDQDLLVLDEHEGVKIEADFAQNDAIAQGLMKEYPTKVPGRE